MVLKNILKVKNKLKNIYKENKKNIILNNMIKKMLKIFKRKLTI